MRKLSPVRVNRVEPRELARRSEALEVGCPRCKAVAGQPCQGRRGDRKSCHIERHTLRIAAGEKS
ncbi:zinc finger domain-containing protein [Tritonibacter mobilis]|uniref:zinc finger domain-containing protein n=1 Tax=Tritonibacter mobilis TaxID=379347 RepID=UPI003F690F4F